MNKRLQKFLFDFRYYLVKHSAHAHHILIMRRTHELKDLLQFSILNFGKVIKQRERKRE